MWRGSASGSRDRRCRDGADRREGPRSARSRTAAAIVCAVIAAGLALWLWPRGGGSAVRQGSGTGGVRRPEARIGTVAPAPAPKAADAAKSAASPAPAATPRRETWLGHEIVRTTAVTSGTDVVITRIDTDGNVHKEYTSVRRNLFTNPVDAVLAILLTTPEGAPVPPLPPLGPRADDVFRAALMRPIEIGEDDSEQDARVKRLVMAAREEMLQELDDGRSVNDVIEDHCTYAEERNTLRAEAAIRYREILERDGESAAEEYRARTNEQLAGIGAKPLASPSEMREARFRGSIRGEGR